MSFWLISASGNTSNEMLVNIQSLAEQYRKTLFDVYTKSIIFGHSGIEFLNSYGFQYGTKCNDEMITEYIY